MALQHGSHCVFDLQYHLVICPRYRHPVFVGGVAAALAAIFDDIAATYGFSFLAREIMPDHVHMLVTAPPAVAPAVLVAKMKSISAVKLFKAFPGLKAQHFYGSGLWSRGYYVGAAGSASLEAVKAYIAAQWD